MASQRVMLVEVGSGTVRPMRQTVPLLAGSPVAWDGFSIEEYRPHESESKNVSLLDTVVFLLPDGNAALEWHGEGRSVTQTIGCGRISILPAAHPYSARLRVAGRSIIISLKQKLLSGAAAELGGAGDVEPVWAHGIDDPLMRELVMALRSEAGSPEMGNAAYAQSLASTLAVHIIRRHSRASACTHGSKRGLTTLALRRTVQFIDNYLDQEISIQQLAAAADLSPCHFARMFKLSTGIPPHQYLLRCRVARAKHLLLNRAENLAEVALKTGFCDQGHMTRCFRQVLGTTPASFVRDLRNPPAPQ